MFTNVKLNKDSSRLNAHLLLSTSQIYGMIKALEPSYLTSTVRKSLNKRHHQAFDEAVEHIIAGTIPSNHKPVKPLLKGDFDMHGKPRRERKEPNSYKIF